MPPIKALGIYGKQNERFDAVIEGYMKLARVDYKKLMKSAGRNPSTYYKRKKDYGKMTVSDLRTFIKVLKIPEEEVLDFLYDKREVKK